MNRDISFAGYQSIGDAPIGDVLRAKWAQMASAPAAGPDAVPVETLSERVNAAISFDRAESEDLSAWQTPQQTWARRSGDCKDYALMKFMRLRDAGTEAAIALGEIGSAMIRNPQHAWCGARIGGSWYALDNMFNQMQLVTRYANWIPHAVLWGDGTVTRYGRMFTVAQVLGAAA